jgi:hypothetical protein
MSDTTDLLGAAERLMRSRLTYLTITAGALFYFTINYSQAGISKETLDAYAGLLGLATLIYLYVLNSKAAGADLEPNVEAPLTGKTVAQRWEVMAGAAVISLLVTITVVAIIHRMTSGSPQQIEYSFVWPNLMQQAFVVVTTETLIFQMMLPEVIRRTARVAPKSVAHYLLYYGGSQGIFAAMHWTAYGGAFQSLAFVFGLGCVLLYLADRYGGAAAWGVHLGWNLMVLGVILGSV